MSSSFHPAQADRFVAACGGYRRWELTTKEGVLWWRLASDWGQAHIRGLVVPANATLRATLDLREPTIGGATVALVTQLVVGRLGVDGLPFRTRTSVDVSLSAGTLRIAGEDVVTSVSVSIGEALEHAVVVVAVARREGRVEVELEDAAGGGARVALAAQVRATPSCLVFFGGGTNGAPESGFGVGVVVVE